MTDDEMDYAIALLCSWEFSPPASGEVKTACWKDPDGRYTTRCPLYTRSLNAMADAETFLTPKQNALYDGWIIVLQGFDRAITFFNEDGSATEDFAKLCQAIRSAPAKVRAQAFLLAWHHKVPEGPIEPS